MNINSDISVNEHNLKMILQSDDIIFYKFNYGEKQSLLVYVDALVDKDLIGSLLLKSFTEIKMTLSVEEIAQKTTSPDCSLEKELGKVIEGVLDGKSAIIIDGEVQALVFDMKKYDSRAVSEPPTSAVVKGPREGFTESIKTNISLLRRRLKTPDLNVEYLTVGKYSKTQVAICYISSICDTKIVDRVKEQISILQIDGIPDSSYIAEQIIEHKKSLFKQYGSTEKPDILMAKMLEGRVGIIVDGSPISITVPYLFIEDFQSSEDYYKSYYRANMQRIIRLISILFAVLLPAFYVSAQLFHLQLIPLNFLLTIVSSIKGIPLTPSLEMFFTLLVFEILNEASIRMPKYVGMALSIVGALVLGDTAVRAGIVSTPTIMIIALSGICIYTVPELVDTMSFLRLVFLVAGGTAGGYAIILVCCYLLMYLSSIENFDVAFLSPYAPLSPKGLEDSIYMTFVSEMKERPEALKPKNKIRRRIVKEDKDGSESK